MVKKHLVLAKTGVFDSGGNPVTVSAQDLKDIAETFTVGVSVPVVLKQTDNPHGEEKGNQPKMGDVIQVWYEEKGEQLEGVIDVQEALADAIEKKFYDKWSIGAKKRVPDGKMSLHHLAMLGEIPPAIKDLREKVNTSLNLHDGGSYLYIPYQHMNEPQTLMLSDGNSKTEALEAELAAYREREKQAGRDLLKKSVSGKVPYGCIEGILQLADSYPCGCDIALSDPVTKETTRTSVYKALADVFALVRYPVEPGIISFDDAPSSKRQKVSHKG